MVTEAQREVLEALSVSRTAAHREVQRARVLLLAADGVANTQIAARLGVTAMTVRSWRTRFEDQGLAKFAKVASWRGRKATIPQEVIDEIVDLTQNTTPVGETHWSTRTMAKRAGVSKDTVQRSGPRAGSSHTWSRPSRFPTTRGSRRSSSTWSVCT